MNKKKDIKIIIENVKLWVENEQSKYNNLMNTEVITDESNVYRVILHISPYMAQIIIDEQDFTPYNNIAFEILEMKNGKVNMLYSWYDNEKDDINSIIEYLNIGLHMALFD